MSALPQHLDIHLIRILYMLLTEKNVSRVALKLNQPQPSVSASLRKLRDLTGDPLLVRGAGGMVPTQHGVSLLTPAKRILDEAERLFLQKSAFQPASEARHFHIAAPDYLDSQFLPRIVASIRRESPKSTVAIHNLGQEVDYVKMLSDGSLDLVVGNWSEPPQHLHISKLFDDELACFMRADSPFAQRTTHDEMTLEQYLSLPHIAPSQMQAGREGIVDTLLAKKGVQRNVVVESAYFGLIPTLLTHSDLVLTTGRQFMRAYEKAMPIKAFSLPLELPPMRFYQLWHERVHHAPAHKWLRDLVAAATAQLVQH